MFATCTVLNPGFLASYWLQLAGFKTFLQLSTLAFYRLEDCTIFMSPEENDQYSANYS
jgi:hypothetical protein